MRKWWLKAVIQKIISLCPFKNKVNFIFQKYITNGVNLTDELFNNKMVHCHDHLECCKLKNTNKGRFLELGTGWFPVIPIALYLAGANEIISIDINPLINRQRFLETLVNPLKSFRFGHN